MVVHQLGGEIGAEREAAIRAFLDSLTGSVDESAIARPELPTSGPSTPAPDPS
jgi:cytochrome c peroxidase